MKQPRPLFLADLIRYVEAYGNPLPKPSPPDFQSQFENRKQRRERLKRERRASKPKGSE